MEVSTGHKPHPKIYAMSQIQLNKLNGQIRDLIDPSLIVKIELSSLMLRKKYEWVTLGLTMDERTP